MPSADQAQGQKDFLYRGILQLCYRPPRCTHPQYSYTAPHIGFLQNKGQTNVTKSNPDRLGTITPPPSHTLYTASRGQAVVWERAVFVIKLLLPKFQYKYYTED